jgi:hypothetical protein
LFLIHVLGGSNIPRRPSIETASRSLDLGLGCTLAPSIRLCRRSAVLGDVIPHDGARRAMEKAFTGRCRGRHAKSHRDNNKQQA